MTQRPKILIADDIREIRDIMRLFLDPEFDVIVARNGEEAWELFNAEVPDLVISDIVMPRINGMELLQRIKLQSFRPDTPVMLVTGATADKEVADGLWKKVSKSDGYISKPFTRDQLLTEVRRCLFESKYVLRGNGSTSRE